MDTYPTPLFIFSLPRTGSTLSQRILAAHDEIATVPESHILLPYFYTLKREGAYSEYNHNYTAKGVQSFCLELPRGVDDYLAEIRLLTLRLYAKAAKKPVKYFLDKASAYHLVIDELLEVFPEAKFIFLWRNPLSVVSSLLESWSGGKWKIHRDEIRLFKGIEQLVDAHEKYADRGCTVRYEDLLIKPEAEWGRVFDYLGLSFDATVLTRFAQVNLKGGQADQPGMKRYQALSREPLEKWKTTLANPIRKVWCRRYLRWIGRPRLARMGYDYDELMTNLDALPFSLNHLPADLWHVPYGQVYKVFEGQILANKFRAFRAGQRLYMYK